MMRRAGRSTIAVDRHWRTLVVILLVSCSGGPQDQPPPQGGSTIPPLVDGSLLEAGTFALGLPPLTITFTVPDGWEAGPFYVVPTEGGAQPPTGTAVGFWIVDNIFADPCRWDRGLLDPPPGPSAADLATALKDQRGRYATNPTPGELNGRPTIEMELTVPPDLDFSECSNDKGPRSYYISWPQRDPPGGGRYHQGPGQRDRLWILEVDGVRLVVDASYFPETSAADRAELWRIVRSVHVE